MLAEMVYDGGEIAWTVVLSVISLAILGLMAGIVIDMIRQKPNQAEYFVAIGIMAFLAFVIVTSTYLIFRIPSEKALGLTITRDLKKQSFCVNSVSTHMRTALLCSSNDSLYEVKVVKQGDQWVAKSGSQRLIQEPTTTSTTTKPLRPSDLDTEPD